MSHSLESSRNVEFTYTSKGDRPPSPLGLDDVGERGTDLVSLLNYRNTTGNPLRCHSKDPDIPGFDSSWIYQTPDPQGLFPNNQ